MNGLTARNSIVMGISASLALLAISCGESGEDSAAAPETTCTGKCDAAHGNIQLLSGLTMFNYASADGESESFALIGEVAEAYYFEVEQGQKLSVEVFAVGGADNPDFKIPAELVYEEDGIGAFASETIDTSLLLPWQVIHVQVSGELGGRTVDQTFEFQAGNEVGQETFERASIAPLANLSMLMYESQDGEVERFALYADVVDAYYDVVPDEHTLHVEIYAADGASNPEFKVTSTITYDADAVGGYTSDLIDTSELLPWQLLKIRIVGELAGEFVDQTFEFTPGDIEAT